MFKPELSIVMSVYNGEKELASTMESIFSQTFSDFEFIIVNDGSTDTTFRILEEYAKKDNRIRILNQENQGLTRALIYGCLEARGDLIVRQDAGDISLPERLMLQKSVFEDKEIVFVSCWTEFCGPEGEFLYVKKGSGKSIVPVHIISDKERWGKLDSPTHHGSVMFRKSTYLDVGGYRAEFYYGQDNDLWYRLAEKGKFQMIEKVLYKAMLMPKSISAHGKEQQEEIGKLTLEALQLRRQGLSDDNILKQVDAIRPGKNIIKSKKAEAAWLYFIGEQLRINHNFRAFKYFKQSIIIYPFFLKSWARIFQVILLPRKICHLVLYTFPGIIGLRKPSTSIKYEELEVIRKYAAGKKILVEIGVFEGISALEERNAMDENGELYLIDPYENSMILGFNVQLLIANRYLKKSNNGRIFWIRDFSFNAIKHWHKNIDYLFIDANHSERGFEKDLNDWGYFVQVGGIALFHDARQGSGTGVSIVVDRVIRNNLKSQWKIIEECQSIVVAKKVK